MTLISAIPALPVSNIERAIDFYADRLLFSLLHSEPDFAVLQRDDVRIHLWLANDANIPGAEPHLAGSASCRILSTDLTALYAECRAAGIVHPNGPLTAQAWGDDDFSVLDQDGNLISFFAATPR